MTNAVMKPGVLAVDNQRVVYKKKNWLFFNWWEQINTISLGKELHVISPEPFNRVVINDEEYIKK